MSKSREEIEKIVGDFDKIARREEKKSGGSNVKIMIFVVSIVIAVILVVLYFYMGKFKKISKNDTTPKAENGNSAKTN